MNITAGDFGNDGLMNKELNLESGDHSEERKGGKKEKGDKEDNNERHLEPGDNPKERGKNS